MWSLTRTVVALTLIYYVEGYAYFQEQIPNGEMVPHPCKPNYLWKGVGHENLNGAGKRNVFGVDFKANNFIWDTEICMKDSDGDGLTNGEELGDPECTWSPGTPPKFTTGLSHPGVCDPMDSANCAGKTDFVDCDAGEFICPAVNETGTFPHTIRIPETNVPAKETTYICMLFEFPSHDDFHLVATEPHIDTVDIMHHIIIYGCDPSRNVSNPLNEPFDCNMQADDACNEIIGLWTVGVNGYCNHPEVGFKVGATGFRIGALEMHWNNPQFRSDYMDSSGMTFYLTPNLRPNEAGVLMIGQAYLEIPPHQARYSTEGRCDGHCTPYLMEGPVYITETFNHMHYLGIAQRTELIQNNVSLDLAWDRIYSYDSPKIHIYNEPVVMRPGDELRTTCTFKSTSRSVTTYFGESTSAEMCFAFLMYYPKQNFKTTSCNSLLSIGTCDWYSGTIQGCDIRDTNQETAEITLSVEANCIPGKCQQECLQVVREFKKHPCFSGDIGKFGRHRAVGKYQRSSNTDEVIWYAKFDSCDRELAQEECRFCGDGIVGGAEMAQYGFTTTLSLILMKMFV